LVKCAFSDSEKIMCLNPLKIAEVGFVACRECWQCRERRVDDWVGRNVAESKTAKAAHVVTLTYGEDLTVGGIDHLRAAVLTYSDVQKFLKLLRFHGFPVRYFVVGEYGSLKGRAHWHIVLYWQDRVPDVKLRENVAFEHWPHGFTYWDKLTPEAIRYACKYLLKDPADPAKQGYGPMPSKKPPLGDAYFRHLAQQYVDAGLAPQDLFYSFPDVRRVSRHARAKSATALHESARPVRFVMSDKTAENFCRYYVEAWERAYSDRPHPQSKMLLDTHAEYQTDGLPVWGKMPADGPVYGVDPDGWCWERRGRKAPKNYVEYNRDWRNPDAEWIKKYHGTQKPDFPPRRAAGETSDGKISLSSRGIG
jgi:hypothetical protein